MNRITRVINREGTETGEVVGSRRCRMSGCRADCLCVKWPDGKRTWPCMRGMQQVNETTMQIQ